MKTVDPKDDAVGKRVMDIVDDIGAKDYIFLCTDKNNAGVTLFGFESTSGALTLLSLLLNAVPELFDLFLRAILAYYADGIRGAFQKSGELTGDIEKKVGKPVDMSDYVKGVKF